MCVLVRHKTSSIKYIALAVGPFSGPCYSSLLGVECHVISIADEVAHDTKKGSIARAKELVYNSLINTPFKQVFLTIA